MLIGEYKHSIDKKRRVSIPAKMRKVLGDRIIITRGLDQCLFIYSIEEWQAIAQKLSHLSIGQPKIRQFVRIMLSGAGESEIDSLGRILIPEHLKNYASLNKKVVITGVYTRAEIWDEEKWNQYNSTSEKRADELAEELGQQGLY
ncbi:MAG: cell division/cell wall cluster transcriptional repressor MraZ [Candidatus Ryanbacteria bacterium RIFCSPHIGHO2_02_FULL_45_43]|uniref:Transcriptional regulator MraZ n=1 Tax=Candidatus Ryanbacteria bacterium RIFCSPHIGHO2_01_45_13 TaxID=1802112 RepID=A0A1G2FZF5_9BACT|nr:MAG: cell division/cell wall cluster transcriptional repressor MraZ [Candidatus Ryanbacteria bacterium RIFCSPHIGHO2_01_FULL_44_130]OGZ42980.1 MAG: cell division/cell wall cluster transcriptional repressor MraZ [Candidatus Ryanbacteria bacterium RIFCSPHIGHO2_01_45_13]OGZ48685.1 MAG: cell division/cell wall cluster transcriptional repressor MraZ [Candidatus Ryanbacteria bacterium RIFCSPHIGHO2_02_FULL_45_43]OGZ50625.1 MAG: cell division/cell wall cluster transcriptional repressor MraZ [Candidatu